jgi:hypothetical protein
MRLLAFRAVLGMADYLMGRFDDQPLSFWCKNRPGATLSALYAEAENFPGANLKIQLHPVWSACSEIYANIDGGKTAMDYCSVCEGDLTIAGTHRTSDGKGGMRHSLETDCT